MPPKKYPQFILFGDSITQYSSYLRDGFSFGAALEEHCQRRLDVINRGLSGYNTAHALHVIEDVIPSASCAKVDYLLVAFGPNDAVLPGFSGQHVPRETFEKNIEAIINHPLVTAHDPTILLVTPSALDEIVCEVEDKNRGYSQTSRYQSVTAQYAESVRRLASVAVKNGQKVVLVDLWKAMMEEALRLTPGYLDVREGYQKLLGSKEVGESGGFKQLLVDGLHFTGAGYKVFFEEVVKHIGTSWKDEPLDAPSWVFPHWSIAPKKE